MARRRLVVEADGGSRGNPGKAGYGALVRDAATGTVLGERAESLGIASNNVAEYSGLVAGLKAALEVDPAADVEVRMDSKLVVEQMSGRWQIKHADMRRLAMEAREVAAELSDGGGSVRYTWVPRAENAAADKLANAAMDGKPVRWTGSNAAEGIAVETRPAEPRPARPDLGEPTHVVLVRHGVTEFTVTGKLDGRGGADPALTSLGRRQAAAAGKAVRDYIGDYPGRDLLDGDPLDGDPLASDPVASDPLAGDLLGDGPVRLLTSTLARAVETGAAIASALGVEPLTDADWDEQSFGDWDGRTFGELTARFPDELLRLRDDVDYARPGGETHAELVERVSLAFARGVSFGGTVVVATHRKPIMVVLAQLLGIPHDRLWRLQTAPASLTAVDIWSDGGAQVRFVNDTSHLRGL